MDGCNCAELCWLCEAVNVRPKRISDFEVQYLYWQNQTGVKSVGGLATIRDAIREHPAALGRAWAVAKEGATESRSGYFLGALRGILAEAKKDEAR